MNDLPANLARLRLRDCRRKCTYDDTEGADEARTLTKMRRQEVSAPASSRRAIVALVEMWRGGEATPPSPTSNGCEPSPIAAPSLSLARSSSSAPLLALTQLTRPVQEDVGGVSAPAPHLLPPLLANTIGRVGQLPATFRRQRPPAVPSAPLDSMPPRLRPALPPSFPATVPFSCVVVDLETTGFSATSDEILEVACVELCWELASSSTATCEAVQPTDMDSSHLCELTHTKAAVAVESIIPAGHANNTKQQGASAVVEGRWTRGQRMFHRFVRPSSPHRIPTGSTAVHGITWDAVRHCDDWPTVAKELILFLSQVGTEVASSPSNSTVAAVASPAEGCVVHLPPMVAHNATFDARFLAHHLRRLGYRVVWHPQYPLTCTLEWARAAYPHVACSLDALSSFMRLDGAAQRAASHHSALKDAKLTALLFLRMCIATTQILPHPPRRDEMIGGKHKPH